jgi:hypothetical protein
VLDEAAFKSIARLPSQEVLIGQFAGIVASPLTGIVRGLNALIQGLASQLGQIADQGLVTGEAPAAPTAGPVADETSSSSQAAGEDAPSAPPADEAGAETPQDEAPAEEAPADDAPKAEAEAPAEDQPAAEAADGSDENTSDDSNKEEG